jgi:DNA (cytosine-5)-methyltransferase 1
MYSTEISFPSQQTFLDVAGKSVVVDVREQIATRSAEVLEHIRERNIPFHIVSLFSGCGGLDLGFRGDFFYLGTWLPALGYKLIWANDNSEGAVATYKHNLGTHIHFGNIETYDQAMLPPATVVIGGFPCQDFSSSGSRTGIHGKKGGLYRYMRDAIAQIEPLCFVAENVLHLKKVNGGADYSRILDDLTHAGQGYNVVCWDLHAVDYGIAQTRKRLFFIGFRRDIGIGSECITPPPSLILSRPLSSFELLEDLRTHGHLVPNQAQVSRAGLLHPSVKSQGDETIRKDQPSPTIRATHHGRIQYHYEEPRRLTVREAARLQTFPDDFVFTQTMTDNYRQVGNAVPPVLGWHVAARVREILDEIVFLLPSPLMRTMSNV